MACRREADGCSSTMSTSGLRPATKLDFSPKGTTSTRSLPRCTARRVVQGCRGSTHHAGVVNPPAWGAGGLAAGCGGGAAAGARGSAAGSRRLPPNICDGSHARFSSILFRRSGEPVLQLPPPRDMWRMLAAAGRSIAWRGLLACAEGENSGRGRAPFGCEIRAAGCDKPWQKNRANWIHGI